jgi:hypothetical protein
MGVSQPMFGYRHRPGSSRRFSTAVTPGYVAVQLKVVVTLPWFSAHIPRIYPD